MKKLTALFFLLLPIMATGQQLSINYSPSSVKAWGEVPQAQMIDIRLNKVGAMYINIMQPSVDIYRNVTHKQVAGIYYTPVDINLKFLNLRAGGIVFDKKTPTRSGTRYNFYFSAGINCNISNKTVIGFEYTHISNAWTGEINPGYDFPTFRLGFNL